MRSLAARALSGGRLAGGRRWFLIAGLAVGVAALVVVRGLADGLRAGIAAEARAILSADVVLDGRRPFSQEALAFFGSQKGVTETALTEFSTMVRRPEAEGKSLLAELRVVRGVYPLIGSIELDPPGPLDAVLSADTCAVADELCTRLSLSIGDALQVGRTTFRIAARIVKEPARVDVQLVEGPRVYLSEAGLERTGLMTFGTRTNYKRLYRFDPPWDQERLAAAASAFEAEVADAPYIRVRTPENAQPSLEQGLNRVSAFLGLVALASLLLSGLGVAEVTRAFIAERMRALAIMRCLGFRPREILGGALQRLLGEALLGSLLGVAIAAACLWLLPQLLPPTFPREVLTPWQPRAMLAGLGLGLGIATVFALPPLFAIWRVSPALVLREEARPLPRPKWAGASAALSLGLGLIGSAWVVTGSAEQALGFSAGAAATVVLLWLAARGLSLLVRVVPRTALPASAWHGLAALARPGSGTRGALIAMGVGVLVVCGIWAIELRLRDGLTDTLPEEAPSAFLLDIQPDQWPALKRAVEGLEATSLETAPMVTGRLTALKGQPVRDLVRERQDGQRGRWVLTREQRLSTRRDLPSDNRVLARLDGAASGLWLRDGVDEVSIEAGFAKDLGVGVGDVLRFDVQGVEIDLLISTVREVNWQRFGINFFLIVEPGVIDAVPGFQLATVRVPEARESELRDVLAANWPNVSVIGIREVVTEVLGLLARVALAVRALGAFTVVVGLVILAGAVTAGALKRGREVALWKALGVSRRSIAAFFAIEFGLVGAVAGLLGGVAALAGSELFLDSVLKLDTPAPWAYLPLVVLTTSLLCVGCGLLSSARALRAPPLVALRAEI